MRSLSNRIKFILIGTFALANAAPTIAQDPEDVTSPAHTLVMFGANWCAPCLEELRNLPALAAGMAPERVVLVWQDGPPRKLWPSWPANAEIKPATEGDRLAGGAPSAGLPYAVLLDSEGKRCAVWNGKMTPERLPRLKARCPETR